MMKFFKIRKYFFSSRNWGMQKTAPLGSEVFYIKYDNINNKILKYKLYKVLYPIFQIGSFIFIYDNSFQNHFLNLSPYFYSFTFLNFMFLNDSILGMSFNEKKNELFFCIYDWNKNTKWVLLKKNSIIFKKCKNYSNNFFFYEIDFEDSKGNFFSNKSFYFSKDFNLCNFLNLTKIHTFFEKNGIKN